MRTEDIRRILRTSMAGCIFIASALVFTYFGPWPFASPQLHFQYRLLTWDLLQTDSLVKISVYAIIFATLLGISKKWWWGIVVCLCFATIPLAINFDPSYALISFIVLIVLMLCLCILAGMLLFMTRFPGWINPSRKIVRYLLELAMVLILIGAGLFFGRVLAGDKPVLFLSAYKTAQANNWQIQKIEMLPNTTGDYYEIIALHLSDGSTKYCLYDRLGAEESALAHLFDLTNMSDVQTAVVCPDSMNRLDTSPRPFSRRSLARNHFPVSTISPRATQ